MDYLSLIKVKFMVVFVGKKLLEDNRDIHMADGQWVTIVKIFHGDAAKVWHSMDWWSMRSMRQRLVLSAFSSQNCLILWCWMGWWPNWSHSISDYYTFVGNKLVTWHSKKQLMIARSSVMTHYLWDDLDSVVIMWDGCGHISTYGDVLW